MVLIRALVVGLILLTLAGCAAGNDEREDRPALTATVVKGDEVAPTEMRRGQRPVARHLAYSEVIIYLSSPVYSGSCPPTGEVEESGDDTVTLTIDTDEDICTADANRYTFLIQGFTIVPAKLIVIEEGEETIELDLSD